MRSCRNTRVDFVYAVVRKVRKVDDAIERDILAPAIFVHPCTCIVVPLEDRCLGVVILDYVSSA